MDPHHTGNRWQVVDGERHQITGWTRNADDEPIVITACGRTLPTTVDQPPAGEVDMCGRCAR